MFSPLFFTLISIFIYASLITIAMASTKLKDKAVDKDNLFASLFPGTLISLANVYSKPMLENAKKLVFFFFLFYNLFIG
jgi:hypothetical protein